MAAYIEAHRFDVNDSCPVAQSAYEELSSRLSNPGCTRKTLHSSAAARPARHACSGSISPNQTTPGLFIFSWLAIEATYPLLRGSATTLLEYTVLIPP